MPLPLTVSCFSKILIGFTFLLPAHLGSPGQRAVKRVCVVMATEKNYFGFLTLKVQFWSNVKCYNLSKLSQKCLTAPAVTNWHGYKQVFKNILPAILKFMTKNVAWLYITVCNAMITKVFKTSTCEATHKQLWLFSTPLSITHARTHAHSHTHTRLTALCLGLSGWAT